METRGACLERSQEEQLLVRKSAATLGIPLLISVTWKWRKEQDKWKREAEAGASTSHHARIGPENSGEAR